MSSTIVLELFRIIRNGQVHTCMTTFNSLTKARRILIKIFILNGLMTKNHVILLYQQVVHVWVYLNSQLTIMATKHIIS